MKFQKIKFLHTLTTTLSQKLKFEKEEIQLKAKPRNRTRKDNVLDSDRLHSSADPEH